MLRRDDFDRAWNQRLDVRADACLFCGADEIGLVEDDEIGAKQLILEHFPERIIVLDCRIGCAPARQPCRIVGEAAVRDRRPVDDRDDAIDRQSCPNLRPVERLDQGFWQSEARGFDDDMVWRRIER